MTGDGQIDATAGEGVERTRRPTYRPAKADQPKLL